MKTIRPLIISITLLLATSIHAAEDASSSTEAADTAAAESGTSEATAEPTIATADLLEQQKQADIATAQSPETELFWLDAGEQKRLALYLPSITPKAHAGIIIFPDTTTSADWPDFIHPLRTDLTEHGWSTLTLNLPPESGNPVPARSLPARQDSSSLQPQAVEPSPDNTAANTSEAVGTATESNKNSDTTITSDNGESLPKATYAELLSELSTAATGIAVEKGHDKQVILGVGNGAVWAMYYFLNNASDNQALVLVDPQESSAPNAPTLTDMTSQLGAPVLDLWFDNTHRAREQAAMRKRIAMRNKVPQYTQIRLNRIVDATGKEPQWLTKQVRGILQSRLLKQMARPAAVKAPEGVQLTPGS